jgi:hypothetical protein
MIRTVLDEYVRLSYTGMHSDGRIITAYSIQHSPSGVVAGDFFLNEQWAFCFNIVDYSVLIHANKLGINYGYFSNDILFLTWSEKFYSDHFISLSYQYEDLAKIKPEVRLISNWRLEGF